MMADLFAAVGFLMAVGVSIGASGPALGRMGVDRERARKVPHATSAVLCALGVYVVDDWRIITAVTLAAAALLAVSIELRLMPGLLQGTRSRDYGFVSFALGFALATWLFWPDRPLVVAGLLTLGFADTAASVVGTRWPRGPLTAWGCHRTLAGGAAFALVCLAVSLAVLPLVTGQLGVREVVVAVFVALSAAALEMTVPSAFDNLLIPLWVPFLLSQGAVLSDADVLRWGLAAVVCFGGAPLFQVFRWVDRAGVVATGLFASAAVALGGWSWLLPVTVFFASTSVLTKFRQPDARARRPRNAIQVFVNGGLPLLPPAVGYALSADPVWLWISTGAVAAANADTWASEVGRHARRAPISLRTFRPVPPGASGGVTLLGSAATLVGGLIIGAVGALVLEPSFLLVGTLAGVGGSLFDSVLGAWVQGLYGCPQCGEVVEEREHCGMPCKPVRGVAWIDNNTVNVAANLAGMSIAFALFAAL